MYETNPVSYKAHQLMYLADPLLNKVYYLTDETNPLLYNCNI